MSIDVAALQFATPSSSSKTISLTVLLYRCNNLDERDIMIKIEALLLKTLETNIASDVKILSIERWQEGRQGYSGAEISYYDAASVYPGFKCFGVGLGNWCFGDPPHRREHVLHFIDMIVK